MAPRASVVIPIYQRVDLTRACLAALERAGLDAIELVLVDNASTDGMDVLLDEWEGSARVIRNAGNLGFAVACNQGAQAASSPVVVFLNTDTEVHDGWLEPLLAAVEHPSVGLAGSRLLYPNGRVQHAGMAILPGCIPWHIHRGVPGDHAVATQTRDLTLLTAACVAIRSDLFQEAGGFDTGYRNGFEDADLCMSLAARGLVARYCGDSVVTHHESMSPGRLDHDGANAVRFRRRWMVWPSDWARLLAEDGLEGVGPAGAFWVGPLLDESPEAELGRAAVAALDEQGLAPAVRETVAGPSASGVGARCPDAVIAGLNRWALAGPGLRLFQHVAPAGTFMPHEGMGSQVAVLGPRPVGHVPGAGLADAIVAVDQALAEAAATLAPERTVVTRRDDPDVEHAAAALIGDAPRVRPGVGWLGPALGADAAADLARSYLAALAATTRPVRFSARDEPSEAGESLPALGRQDFEPALWIVGAPWNDPAGPTLWEQSALALSRPLVGVVAPARPVPPAWVAACDYVCEVWVPTEDGREALVEAGVDREKVVAIPAPVDARLFAPCPRAVVEGPFTVVAEVDWISGGGFESILRAWVEEFEAGDPVRLLLCGPDGRGDAAARVLGLLDDLGQDPEAIPDVELLLEPLAPAALAETYRGADAAVVVAGGDPAGLRAARATACGLTVVTAAPGASCLREELRRAFEGRPSGAPTARCEHSLADAADAVDARLVRLLG